MSSRSLSQRDPASPARRTHGVWPAQADTPKEPSHLIASVNATLTNMTTSPVRRKRGTGIGNVQLVTSVPSADKQIVVDFADQAGLSQSEAMEVILKHLRGELAPDGIPTWFDRKQLPEALPIAKAS